MGLKAIRGKAERQEKRELVLDLSPVTGEESDTLTFREPGVSELFTPAGAREQFAINFPEFSAELTSAILLMAACYVPQAADGEINAAFELGSLARENRDGFLYIFKAFNEAFPDIGKLSHGADAAKNG